MGNDIKNKFLGKIEDIKKDKTITTKEEVFSVDLSAVDFDFCNIEGADFNKLKDISIKIFSTEAKGKIALGTFLNEAFEILTNDSNYEKWLPGIGINKKTALRYRKRATLYNACLNTADKSIVAMLPQSKIDKIYADRTLLEHLDSLKNSEIEEQEENEEKQNSKEKNVEIVELSEEFINSTFDDIVDRLDELDYDVKAKVQKKLLEIEKIIKG